MCVLHILGFPVSSIILADLLENTCLLAQVQKGHGLWFKIGRLRSVLIVLCFKVCCFVIFLFWAIIDYLSLLCRFLWSFSFLLLARIKQHLPPSFDKKSTHRRNFLRYSRAFESFSAKLGELITLWFALTPPSLKWSTEQKIPKSLLSLQITQRETMNFAVTYNNNNDNNDKYTQLKHTFWFFSLSNESDDTVEELNSLSWS